MHQTADRLKDEPHTDRERESLNVPQVQHAKLVPTNWRRMLCGCFFALIAVAFPFVVVAPPVPPPELFERKMQLPTPLRDPLVALVGEKCYVSLVENFNITDIDCVRYSISKALGFGIVLGGSIVKIPQIVTILLNGSAQGLSLASYLLETSSNIISFAYNWRQGNPFSTYGEILFLTIQNILISILILFFARRYGASVGCLAALASFIHCLTNASIVPSWLLSSLYASTIPLNLASKVPQIYTNYVNKSTGQLSVFAVLNYFLGSTARVFTTMTELDDPLMLFGGILASTFNGILLAQVVLYWGKKVDTEKPKKAD